MSYATQAIVTRYLGPTNHRGARVSARCEAGRLVVPWDHALGVLDNHACAAQQLAQKLEWDCRLVLGSLPDRTGYVAVPVLR